MQQPAVRYRLSLDPAALQRVVAPPFAASLRGIYGGALGLPMEAVLLAGVMEVRSGKVTQFLSTDDVNVEGNGADAAQVLASLLSGGVGASGSGGGSQRRVQAAATPQPVPNALNIAGLAPSRNASSAAVALFFNAFAPCPPPCNTAQNGAASRALAAAVAATAGNASLLAGVLGEGEGWHLDTAAIIPFSLPRVLIKWSPRAWLASLPTWVVGVSAAGSALCCALGVGACLWWRKLARRRKGRVAVSLVDASEEAWAAGGEASPEGAAEAGFGRNPPRVSSQLRARGNWGAESGEEEGWDEGGRGASLRLQQSQGLRRWATQRPIVPRLVRQATSTVERGLPQETPKQLRLRPPRLARGLELRGALQQQREAVGAAVLAGTGSESRSPLRETPTASAPSAARQRAAALAARAAAAAAAAEAAFAEAEAAEEEEAAFAEAGGEAEHEEEGEPTSTGVRTTDHASEANFTEDYADYGDDGAEGVRSVPSKRTQRAAESMRDEAWAQSGWLEHSRSLAQHARVRVRERERGLGRG